MVKEKVGQALPGATETVTEEVANIGSSVQARAKSAGNAVTEGIRRGSRAGSDATQHLQKCYAYAGDTNGNRDKFCLNPVRHPVEQSGYFGVVSKCRVVLVAQWGSCAAGCARLSIPYSLFHDSHELDRWVLRNRQDASMRTTELCDLCLNLLDWWSSSK
jgi:hypothetical protein